MCRPALVRDRPFDDTAPPPLPSALRSKNQGPSPPSSLLSVPRRTTSRRLQRHSAPSVPASCFPNTQTRKKKSCRSWGELPERAKGMSLYSTLVVRWWCDLQGIRCHRVLWCERLFVWVIFDRPHAAAPSTQDDYVHVFCFLLAKLCIQCNHCVTQASRRMLSITRLSFF